MGAEGRGNRVLGWGRQFPLLLQKEKTVQMLIPPTPPNPFNFKKKIFAKISPPLDKFLAPPTLFMKTLYKNRHSPTQVLRCHTTSHILVAYYLLYGM